jgi:hypothetical protein
MPYAPTVNDRSGEILGEYTANAANIRAQGMQSFGKSIGEGLESMGSSISEGMTKARENAIKYDTAAGMLDTYKENAGALGLDLNILKSMEQKLAGNPDKLIGALTVVGKLAENKLDIQKAEATYAALGNAYTQKAAATAAAKADAPMKMNSESIRSMVSEAKAAGFTDDAIKTKLAQQYGEWAVRSVYPPQNQGIWMGQ